MKKLYKCEYVHPRSGRPCIRGSYEPGYCHVHRKSPVWYPCPYCGKLTCSKYGVCDKHAMKYRKREQSNRKKAKKEEQKAVELQEYKTEIKEDPECSNISAKE
jgi:hypothetical protein